MAERVRSRSRRVPAARPRRGHYFPPPKIRFVPSGCTTLDCVLGGGWPLGRIANIVGDKAVGKTLLAIEACANFAHAWPRGHIWYREVESAFDPIYAEQLGLPTGQVDFGPDGVDTAWETVEDIYEDLHECLAAAEKSGQPGLYVVDSLDALSDRAEMKRAIDKGSYGTDKAAVMSELFRRLKKRIKRAQVAVIIVSQLRDKIGVMFGERQTRTGGRALDFYASQILWLHYKGKITSEVGGVERATGVRIRAHCKKNKIVATFGECEFILRFGYGTDDLEACVAFLREVGMLDRVGLPAKFKTKKEEGAAVGALLRSSVKMSNEEVLDLRDRVAAATREAWAEVEDRFRPARKKYG